MGTNSRLKVPGKEERVPVLKYLALTLIIIIVFFTFPMQCGAHDSHHHHDHHHHENEPNPSFKYSKEANEHSHSHGDSHIHSHSHGEAGHSHDHSHHQPASKSPRTEQGNVLIDPKTIPTEPKLFPFRCLLFMAPLAWLHITYQCGTFLTSLRHSLGQHRRNATSIKSLTGIRIWWVIGRRFSSLDSSRSGKCFVRSWTWPFSWGTQSRRRRSFP